MMDLYKFVCDSDHYHSVLLENVERYQDTLYQFSGRRLAETWSPLRVRLYKTRYSGDFPHLTSHVPVFSERAAEVLHPLIGDTIELLPLECNDDEKDKRYFAVHVLELVDCLDYRQSQIKRDPDGEIIFIDRYEFIEEKIRDRHIFRIEEVPLKDVIVSNHFKSLVEEKGLRGLKLRKIA